MTLDPAVGEARGVRESLVLGEHSAKESSSSLAKYLFTASLEPGSDRMGRVSEIDGGTAGFHEAPNAVPADSTEEGSSASAADGSVWSVRWGAEEVNSRRRWRSVLIVALATLVVLGIGVVSVFAGGRWLFGDKIVLPATLGGMSLTRDQKVMLVEYDFTADPPNNGWYAKAAGYGDASRFAVLTLYQWAAWDSPRSAESEMQSLVNQFQAMPGPDATTRLFSLPAVTGDDVCATESMIDDVTGKTDEKYELCARLAGHVMALVLTSPANATGAAALVDSVLEAQ